MAVASWATPRHHTDTGKTAFDPPPIEVQVVPVGTQFNEYALWVLAPAEIVSPHLLNDIAQVERQLQIHGFYAEACKGPLKVT